jgi:hypothetical protein
VLPVLVLAALVALPATASSADLPAGADPCLALTPAVVDQLRISGALTPLVPAEIRTSTLIATGRSLTGCPPAGDPDPATTRARVCPLLTGEGVAALADRLRATPAVRADLGPERVAIARNALHCDGPAATEDAVAVETSVDQNSGNTVGRPDRGLPQNRFAVIVAICALLGALLLLVAVRPRRHRSSDADDGADVEQRSTPNEDADVRRLPDNRSDSYDELLEGLRREVTELQRTDDARRKQWKEPEL